MEYKRPSLDHGFLAFSFTVEKSSSVEICTVEKSPVAHSEHCNCIVETQTQTKQNKWMDGWDWDGVFQVQSDAIRNLLADRPSATVIDLALGEISSSSRSASAATDERLASSSSASSPRYPFLSVRLRHTLSSSPPNYSAPAPTTAIARRSISMMPIGRRVSPSPSPPQVMVRSAAAPVAVGSAGGGGGGGGQQHSRSRGFPVAASSSSSGGGGGGGGGRSLSQVPGVLSRRRHQTFSPSPLGLSRRSVCRWGGETRL